jgi:HSP20 family protein
MVDLASEMGPGHRPARSADPRRSYYNFSAGETWAPSVNLYENDTAYLVCVDLAGVEKEKIDVTVDRNMLSLKGTRAVPVARGPGAESGRLRVHVMEIDHGMFCRHVELPEDVIKDRITASYNNGLLWIELPKK